MSGCTQCGACCKKYGMRLEASPLDIARWTLDRRQDILRHVRVEHDGAEVTGGQLWINETGERATVCPFLELHGDKYYCQIQDVKPEVCTWHYCRKYLEG